MTIFDEDRARTLLATACAAVGLPAPDRAGLLALGENAVFDLGDPALVAKVGRSATQSARAGRELAVAHWLDTAGVPVVRPYGTEPTAAEGHPVTFWHRLPAAVRPARTPDLAPLLRSLHRLPEPPATARLTLEPRGLLAPVPRWLAAAEGSIDPADAAFLLARRDELDFAIAELVPALAPGVIHGDALPRNVQVGPDGPVLLDLEYVATDLREHDLVVVALAHGRYGAAAEDYDAFAAGYGWDVRDWPGFTVLRDARETAGAAWVAQHVPGNPAARAEFGRRVESLRTGDRTVRWRSF